MKILFIGNSHTYMNDLPKLVGEMIEDATGEKCDAVMLASSARSLKWHMAEEYFSERFNILHGNYDFCIIQERAHPMGEESDTIKYATQIFELCKKSGTAPVIFETWAKKDNPENQIEMNRRYQDLSRNHGVLLAPIGEVWASVSEELLKNLDEDLYYKDGAHASSNGTYLIAMVLTKVISQKLPSKSFLKSYDFTTPDSEWIPVNENVEDEVIEVNPAVADIIRRYVEATLSTAEID